MKNNKKDGSSKKSNKNDRLNSATNQKEDQKMNISFKVHKHSLKGHEVLFSPVDLQRLTKEFEFLENSIDEILMKRLAHGNEVGYVQVNTDGNYEVMSIKFIPMKWFKKANFTKIDLFEVFDGYTDTGELYFEVIWFESFTKTKLYCDYYVNKSFQITKKEIS